VSADLVEKVDAFAANLSAALAERGENVYQGMPSDADSPFAYKRMGQAGLIGLHWPTRLGGQELDPTETLSAEESFGYHWLPLSGYLLSVKTIGNALIRFATPDLADQLLPEVATGSLIFCQGFSEPSAGSDLASLRTRARVSGNKFVVNGRKIWTSSAEHADWVYLAARTHPHEPRHRGVSVMVLDIRSPGIEVSVHRTLGGGTLGEIVFQDVEVPRGNLVGELHAGWKVLMGTLDFERVTSEKVGVVERLLDQLTPHCSSAEQRRFMRQLRGETRAARLLGRRATDLLTKGLASSSASSMAKLSVAALMQKLARFSADVLGPEALVEPGGGGPEGGRFAAFVRACVATTISGGASDIQRRVIARQGLSRS
jgi:3-oxocholest-4-en-26-oyl-CoA dehydrogenase alpha subunit